MPENLHDDAPRPEKTAGRLIAPFDPESWRQQVLELGLRIAVVLGAIVYAPSVLTAIRFDQWGIVLLDSLALAGVIALMVARRCPFMLRASLFSLILFMLGAWLMIEVGPISQIYLLGFSILTTLLLGLRVGIATVALNAATLLGIGLAGMAAPSMEIIGREPDLATWATIALNFLLVNIILVVAIGAVVHALERLVDRTREARDELERERAELVMANAALESEMFERARAEESRSAVESRLAATLESMTDAFYMLDREWRFTYINREAERIMQRPREELLGRVAHEEYPENAKGLIGRRYRHAMKTQEPILFEEFDEQLGLWFELRLFPSENGLAVYFRDISRRREAEEALRESEVRFRTVFNQQFQFMAILSPEGRVLEVNDLPLQAGGLKREEVVGKLFWEAGWWDGLPEMKSAWPARLEEAARTRKPLLLEDQYRAADGETRIANSATVAVYNASGALDWIIVQATDITEQRRSEEAARQREALLNIAGRMARLGGWSVAVPGYRLSWSDEVCDIHEVPRGQPPSLEDGINFYAPEYRETITKAFNACAAQGTPFDLELEILTASGKRVWVRAIAEAVRDADGAIVRVEGAFQDISAIKQAEHERSALAERLATTLESINDAFFTLDREWRFTFLNSKAEQLMQRTRDDLLGTSIWEAFSDVVGTISEREYRRAMYEQCSVEFEHDYAPLGMCFEVRGYPTEEGIAVYFRDISERKRADEELRAATDLLGRTFESLDVAVLIVEKGGRTIVRSNPAAEKVFGYTAEEMLGRQTNFLHVDKARFEEFGRRSDQVLVAGEVFRGDFQMRRKDGTIIDTQNTVSALHDEHGEIAAVVSVVRDVSAETRAARERASLEEQLRQSQKMEAVGRLAGGVAHDFNNMLGVILGHAELMEATTDLPEDCRDDLREIADAARRSADLTRQLLAFARKQTIAPEVLQLNDTIESMLKMLRRLVGEDIDFVWKPGSNVEAVMMDPAQIDQILVNLVVNARDAVSTGGRITIETRATELDEDYCEAHIGCEPGRYALLIVSDDGCGMDRETRHKLFEPFFTTKPRGQGTGLGLPTVYGIVQQNGGVIHVYSEPGKGSAFNIYLPSVDISQIEAPSPASTPVIVHPAVTETVLLVEDEPPLLDLGKRMLTRLGYTVLAANRPSEAFQLAGDFEGNIDLLITDVIMPEMTGLDVYQRLIETRPGLKCLYMSGYTADIIAHHGVLDEGLHFIQKPFGREGLRAKIRETLGE